MSTEIGSHISKIVSYCENAKGLHAVGFESTPWRSPHASWQRCMKLWGLDPQSVQRLTRLDSAEVTQRVQPIQAELDLIGPELDGLFQMIKELGYSVGFADRTGVIVRYRQTEGVRDLSGVGEVFSEQIRGTNSVGTCLIEKRALATFRGDHFFTDLMHLSCASAPIYVDNALIGAIDVSTSNAAVTEETHKIVFNITKNIGKKCENILLSSLSAAAITLSFETIDGEEAVLSFSYDGSLLNSNRAARDLLFGLGKRPEEETLWSLFDKDCVAVSERGLGKAVAELKLNGSVVRLLARLKGPAVPLVLRNGLRYAATVGDLSARNNSALDSLAGSDKNAVRSAKTLQHLSEADLPILLLGETGVGKGSWARAVHESSARWSTPFMPVDCVNDLSSVANLDPIGRASASRQVSDPIALACANGGTLLLSRVDELSLAQQSSLLQFLDVVDRFSEGAYARGLGAPRLVATACTGLRDSVLSGAFRRDLYFRLAGVEVKLPPLRARDDFEQIVSNILRLSSGGREIHVSFAAMEALLKYTWPGNIRELKNALRRAIGLAAPENILQPEHLQLPAASSLSVGEAAVTVDQAKERIEDDFIDRKIEECSGNMSLVANSLGVSRTTLYRKLSRRKIVRGA
jgi:transcriptional regulator of acetoin/glycerol metabolism